MALEYVIYTDESEKKGKFYSNFYGGVLVRSTEVESRDHSLLQCLDVVLGAMAFRLNDKHKQKPPGKRRRGKRTIAKERLYKHIRARVCQLYPNFNIGENTGKRGSWTNLWLHPYRHWKFVPAAHEVDPSKTKPKKNNPVLSMPCGVAQVELGPSGATGL